MTNKEKYKQAFSAIHTSDGFSLEVEIMERTAKHHKFKSVAMERIIMFCEQFEIEPVAPSDKRTGR